MSQAGDIILTNAFCQSLINANYLSGVTTISANLLTNASNISESSDDWSDVTGVVASGSGYTPWSLALNRTTSNPYKVRITTPITLTTTSDVTAKFIVFRTNTKVIGYALLDDSGADYTFEANMPSTISCANNELLSLSIS